jgi:capsular exopolysaccharide synthesis family protein
MSDLFLPNQSGAGALAPVDEAGVPGPWDPGSQSSSQTFGFQGFINALYRWRWLFLSIVACTVVAAAAWVSFQTPLYRATATLELNPAPTQVVQTDEKDANSPGPIQSDRDFLALQIGLIKSRNVAQRVARGLDLDRDKSFLRQNSSPPPTTEQVVGTLMNSFSATGTASDRIMEISFVHPNPTVAAQVTNSFAEQAIEANFERGLDATARSREFLERRLSATRRDLETSERALIEYARRAKIINVVTPEGPTSGDSAGGTLVASNLVALNQQLADAQNARIVAQQRYAQASAAGQAAQAADPTVQALQQQKSSLQAQYAQKLQTFKPEYPEMQALQAQISGLDRQIAASRTRASSAAIGSLRADMIAAQNRETALQRRINQLQSQFLDLNDRGVEYTILKRSVDANQSMYNALLQQLGVENSSATRTSSIEVVDRAQVPASPFSPNIPRTLLLALIFGMALGSAGVVGADRFYDTINTPADMKEIGLAVIGVIPAAPQKESVDDLLADPRSPVAEAFHSARASLQFATPGGVPKTILFTSARAAEGKTSASIAIAADFLSVGKRVAVVDADLRKPSLRGDSPGLSAVLAGVETLEDALLTCENPNLFLLPAGRVPPNPTALLTGRAIAEVLEALEQRFDVVIIDGPPVLGFADAPLLAGVCRATVLLVAARSTSRSMAQNACTRLVATGGNLIGGILNKFDRRAAGLNYGDNAYGYYSYEYGGRTPKRSLIVPEAMITKQAAE